MKKILALILAVSMVFALAACGSKDTNNDKPAENNPSAADPQKPAENKPADDGKVYELTVVNHDATTSMCEQYIETLCNAIAEESGGRIKFNYYAGGSMFGAAETIDAVEVGSADICWATTGTYGGVFPVSEFVNLVGNGIDCGQLGTAVINTMYKEMPEVQKEFEKWHVLALHGTSNAPVSTVGVKIEKPADFAGLRLRTAGSIPTIYANALGATATALPTSEVYDNLSKNALDGMLNDWHNIDCFRLYEPIDYCMNVSLNMTTSFVLMNKDSYNNLPADLQALFDKYFNSGFAGDMAGYWWDSCRYWVGDKMLENDVEIYEPSQEVYDFMFSEEVLNQTRDGYIKFLNDKGYDGQKIYDQCMEIVARFAPEFENVWDEPFNYQDWDMSAVEGYKPNW